MGLRKTCGLFLLPFFAPVLIPGEKPQEKF
jgi:hypothetical protein